MRPFRMDEDAHTFLAGWTGSAELFDDPRRIDAAHFFCSVASPFHNGTLHMFGAVCSPLQKEWK